MRNVLERITAAASWKEYYEAYKSVYVKLLQQAWAFGEPGFAGQLHHTVIPDAAGRVAGIANWAVYSQPSSETLDSFLSLFSELLTREPHRLRTNRYLFLVRSGKPLSREIVRERLGKHGPILDYWCGSLEEIGGLDEKRMSLVGIEALVGVRRWASDISGDETGLRNVFVEAKEDAIAGTSVVPEVLREALVGSSVVLYAGSVGMQSDILISILGKLAGVAAFIARMRALESKAPPDRLIYCNKIIKSSQLSFIQYQVKPGDMLSHIVRKHYQTSYTTLLPLIRAVNPKLVNADLLQIGQVLKLPILKSDSRSVQ